MLQMFLTVFLGTLMAFISMEVIKSLVNMLAVFMYDHGGV